VTAPDWSASNNRMKGAGCAARPPRRAAVFAPGCQKSPLLPLEETYTIMQAMDEVRRQIGLSCPPA